MSEFIDEHGEVFQEGPALTPYQVECRKLVAFKLKTIETVTADPALHKAPCVQVMIVYLSFLKVNKETLKRTSVYASSLTLMARGSIKSDRTARNARSLLVDHGYLEHSGKATKEGCDLYWVANPRLEVVAMHVREMAEYLKDRDADRKKEERRKKAFARVPVDTTTPEIMCPGSIYQDVPVATTDKYHREYLRDSCSEGRDESLQAYDDESLIDDLTPPEDMAELRVWITRRCADKSKLHWALALGAKKELTPEIMRELAA